MMPSSKFYNQNAKRLFEKYQSITPEHIHSCWSENLPTKPSLALDVGGASGRDAKWLAEKGWEVVVVEPAKELLNLGQQFTEGYRVTWIDDCLPGLKKLKDLQTHFSLILLSGVLMHLSKVQRLDSLNTLTTLMDNNALMVITLRQGPDEEERDFYKVAPEEIIEFAKNTGLQCKVQNNRPDKLGREAVIWHTVIVAKQE
jgi:2-polyprenyl-3-methyl-5-hydroxy-6-metoxy-1,4-benzoquinol methylase